MSLLRRKPLEQTAGWSTADRLYNYAKGENCSIDTAAAVLRGMNCRVTLADVADAKAMLTRLQNHEKKLRMNDGQWSD